LIGSGELVLLPQHAFPSTYPFTSDQVYSCKWNTRNRWVWIITSSDPPLRWIHATARLQAQPLN